MDYQKYINALRQCAKEHEYDRTPTGDIIVSYLCRDVADLLEALEQKSCSSEDCVSREFMYKLGATCIATRDKNDKLIALGTIENLPPVTPIQPILDKIETEIAQMDFDFGDYYDNTESIIEMVCGVIHKYKK